MSGDEKQPGSEIPQARIQLTLEEAYLKIKALPEEALKLYDEMSFHFQMILSIFQNTEIIALPDGKNKKLEQFTLAEVTEEVDAFLQKVQNFRQIIENSVDDDILQQDLLNEMAEIVKVMESWKAISSQVENPPPVDKDFFKNALKGIRYLMVAAEGKGVLDMEKLRGKMKAIMNPTESKSVDNDRNTPDPASENLDLTLKLRKLLEMYGEILKATSPPETRPLMEKRHRDVRRGNIKSNKLLAEVVTSLQPKELQEDIRRILFQVSTLLAYLEYMWSMHQLKADRGETKLIFPKRMLSLGHLIVQEAFGLARGVDTLITSRKPLTVEEAGRVSMFPTLDQEPTQVLAATYDASVPGVRVADLAGGVHLQVSGVAPLAEAEINKGESQFIDALNTLGMFISMAARGANQTLTSTQLKVIPMNGGSVNTLSNNIYDFITDLHDMLRLVIFEIAKAANPDIDKRALLPEEEVYERQRAELRLRTAKLEKQIRKMRKFFGNQSTFTALDIMPAFRNTMRTLADELDAFGDSQNTSLDRGHYHEVLKGNDYESVGDLAEELRRFNAEHGRLAKPGAIIALRFVNEVSAYADQLSEGDKKFNSPEVKKWIHEVKKLQAAQEALYKNNELATQEEYKLALEKVLKLTQAIAASPSEIAQVEKPASSTDSIPTQAERVRGINDFFADLIQINPCTSKDLDDTYFELTKIIKKADDIITARNTEKQKGDHTPVAIFLEGHDRQKAAVLAENLESALEKVTNLTTNLISTPRKNLDETIEELISLLTISQQALEHVELRDSKFGHDLTYFLEDLKKSIIFMSQYTLPIDLTLYNNMLRTAVRRYKEFASTGKWEKDVLVLTSSPLSQFSSPPLPPPPLRRDQTPPE